MSPFAELGLQPALVHAARQAELDEPTPVQAAAIPAVLAGRDLLALAETGSGKTAAYALPLLQRLLQTPAGRHPRALVLAPTRELAVQIADTLRELAAALPQRIRVALLFGGVSINPQLMGLRGGCDCVVATPGRLLDVIDHNGLSLEAVQTLVLDEADRLMASGFADEWQATEALLPRPRQNLLVSATLPSTLQSIADALLQNPLRVDLAALPTLLTQRAIQVDAAQRGPLLRHLLKNEDWPRAMVFVASRHGAEHVADKLLQNGFQAAALHGELSQGARRDLLAALKSNKLHVLVCTDLAARGLHVPGLSAVINFDLPRAAADYTHRIGRAGRMGQAGVAISFICADSPTNAESHFRLIEKRQGQRVAREQIPGFEPQAVASEATASGGIKGKRPSKKDKLRAAGLR
ncbi:DEAD/DEAH box helicase [Inhella proteolytica]|uniref:DEAD/DEAH box helicase n=1 Tax=Inhella proteolytica TaxID=2795029 RepID=A0A931J706_9BURK|nr:DEAD/DEAH box helicase [Inhella proteolytica]MBH9579416.1 DEAD/DEAH box helicase [Inhella proteolytica]